MKKLILLLLVLVTSFSFAQSDQQHVLKKISLMKYVSQEEAKYGHDLQLSSFRISLIEEAYAYSEGSACLILGFQSTFKNGVCRLNRAEGVKDYAATCKGGTLPCNPYVFGFNEGKPFCVSRTGAELSRYCAHASFKVLTKSPDFSKFSPETQERLKEISQTAPNAFSFSQAKELAQDPSLAKVFLGNFNTLEESKKFTEGLCQSIQAAPRKNKVHELDIKNCEAQLELMNMPVVDAEKITEPEKDTPKPAPTPAVVVEPKKEEENILVHPDLQCVPPQAEIIPEATIAEIQKVPEMLETKALNDCVKELYNHKDVPDSARGKYWHDINGEKYFGKQCWNLDKYGEDEMIFSFLSDEGLKVLKYPVHKYQVNGETYTLPRNIYKFDANGKKYLLSQFNNIGEYFESLPEENLTSFAKEQDLLDSPAKMKTKYIDAYESYLAKNNLKTIKMVPPAEAGITMDGAQSCIKGRLLEYVSMIWHKTHPEALPYFNTLSTDISRTDREAPELKARYAKTVDEVREELKATIFPEGSACRGIINDEDLNSTFNKNYDSRVENYEKVRKYYTP